MRVCVRMRVCNACLLNIMHIKCLTCQVMHMCQMMFLSNEMHLKTCLSSNIVLSGRCINYLVCQKLTDMSSDTCSRCHMSSVICHVSNIMCHVSIVMCHVSNIMCHMSSVTCHVSCVMCHVSCVQCGVL